MEIAMRRSETKPKVLTKWKEQWSEGHSPGSSSCRALQSQAQDPGERTEVHRVQTCFQVSLEAVSSLKKTVIPQGLGSLCLAASQECWYCSGERKWGTSPRTKARPSQNRSDAGDLTRNLMATKSALSIATVFIHHLTNLIKKIQVQERKWLS